MLRRIALFVLVLVVGCAETSVTEPMYPGRIITREEWSRLPPHERDDPYTRQHLQKSVASQPR